MRSVRNWLVLLTSLGILAASVAAHRYWQFQQDREDGLVAAMDFDAVWSAYLTGQHDTAYNSALRLASGGTIRAQVLLGRMYELGHGTPADDTQALNWYLRAADGEHPEAMFAVMSYYAEGRGLQHRNPHGAAHWAERLAEKGDPRAQAYIGGAYLEGYGVIKDPERSLDWLQQAAEAGNLDAMVRLAEAFADGSFGQRDDKTALSWRLTSARFGHIYSMRTAVRMLMNKSRSVFDLEQAYFWALVGTAWSDERAVVRRFLAFDIIEILYETPDGFPPRDMFAADGSLLSGDAISGDPSPSDFDYESWPRRLGLEAQIRVEDEVDDFLTRWPSAPMTM